MAPPLPSSLGALSPAALAAVCPGASRLDELGSDRCAGRVAEWQNIAAADLARKADLPLVPLSAALGARSDLHEPDCHHWCEASEAAVFKAMAVLSTVRWQLRGEAKP